MARGKNNFRFGVSSIDFDQKQFDKSFLRDRSVRDIIYNAAQEALEERREELVEEFDAHPVSREIEEGPDGQNITGTLGGYGNLFSFIGFEEGDEPLNVVRAAIRSLRLNKVGARLRKSGIKIKAEYVLNEKSVNSLSSQTPMPWEQGRSWLYAISRGISGFSYYMAGQFLNSRSGGGIQTKKKIKSRSSDSYIRVSYFSKMYSNFKKKL
jgi:hypothetical protein